MTAGTAGGAGAASAPRENGQRLAAPGTRAKLSFLSRPGAYADKTSRVDVIETHMSWVFLTERFAYKLKKPVRFAFLDYSSIGARRRSCESELRLNRRLAASVYVGVAPLTVDADGGLHLDRPGTAVDWLVVMRRLPAEQMLDRAIARGKVPSSALDAVAERLARFYQDARPVKLSTALFRRRLARDIEVNRRELLAKPDALSSTSVTHIADLQAAFLRTNRDAIERRLRDGRIVEAHGDLRPEHVCLAPEPVVIDCLEFSAMLRCADPADELAFLAMECERLGAARVGGRFLQVYGRIVGDRPPASLVAFYKSCRASMRARIAIWHLDDPAVTDKAKWRGRARAYVDLAGRYARQLPATRQPDGG